MRFVYQIYMLRWSYDVAMAHCDRPYKWPCGFCAG